MGSSTLIRSDAGSEAVGPSHGRCGRWRVATGYGCGGDGGPQARWRRWGCGGEWGRRSTVGEPRYKGGGRRGSEEGARWHSRTTVSGGPWTRRRAAPTVESRRRSRIGLVGTAPMMPDSGRRGSDRAWGHEFGGRLGREGGCSTVGRAADKVGAGLRMGRTHGRWEEDGPRSWACLPEEGEEVDAWGKVADWVDLGWWALMKA